MIDLRSEGLLSLTDAAKALPPIGGKRPHVSTIWRWCRKGVRGVRLEHIRLGHRVCTSLEALNRFAHSLAEAPQQAAPAADPRRNASRPRTAVQRARDVAAAERELESGGV